MNEIPKKVAIVTGGSRGIGAAIVKRLAQDQVNLLLSYRANAEAAADVVRQVKDTGYPGDIMAQACDVSQYAECENLIRFAVNAWGRIDTLVNNAGISHGSFLMTSTADQWWETLHTNLGGVVHCTKAVLPSMMKQKSGKIINIGSVYGTRGAIGNSHYAASKAGIEGFTRSMAHELGRFGITVNTVAPGFIETEMTTDMSDKERKAIFERVPGKRLGKPEEVAEAVAFLASGKVDYIHGHTLIIDGGLSI